ncbi:MAG: DNA polymerase Y family protein [Candidatus Acidiferrales bacterium]|jgi:protein ImuB
MAFASIHIPDFPVQAVVRMRAHLRGRAIALVDGVPPLVKVVAANPVAFAAGIQAGMSKSQAEQFTGIEIHDRSRALEKAAHAALLDLGWSISPRIEDHAPHEIVVDLAGLEALLGSHENIANEMVRRAASLNLSAHIAVAANLEVAIHAARGFAGITVIAPGEEAARLGVLPIEVLLPSEDARETLENWGIRTCAALAALPTLQLSERLGQEGVRLHEHARGTSVRSLVLAQAETFFEEEMELDEAVEDLEPISFLLGRLLDQLCARLAARSLSASAIHLRFDLGDLFEYEAVPSVMAPHVGKATEKIYCKTLTLPVAMRDSKLLLKLMRLQLQSDPPPGSIVKIALAADPARQRFAQTGLFVPSSPDPEKLELVLARIAKLVGEPNVGSAEVVDTHRPGAFRMIHFASPANDRSSRALRRSHGVVQPEAESQQYRPTTAFRVFRPSLQARVELRYGSPARVFFRGLRGYVMSASGPWRTSGDWWREDAWRQDEWDLDIRFDPTHTPQPTAFAAPAQKSNAAIAPTGLYCFCFDSVSQTWFVRGMYD